jgi:hypothetical protein
VLQLFDELISLWQASRSHEVRNETAVPLVPALFAKATGKIFGQLHRSNCSMDSDPIDDELIFLSGSGSFDQVRIHDLFPAIDNLVDCFTWQLTYDVIPIGLG